MLPEFLSDYSAAITLIALTAIFAYSFYAVLMAGQLSLGQAGMASVAGFAAAAVVGRKESVAGLPPLLAALLIGMVVGALVAAVLGLPVMRLRGVFLAIATLGFGEMVRILLLNMEWTGGPQGLSIPKLVTPGIAWGVLALIIFWFWRLSSSKLGRALAAVREDELAARAMGIDVSRTRLIAFVTAGAIAGMYGVLLAFFSRLITPNEFGFSAAVDGLVTAVVGGATSVIGPLLGSAFFTLVPEIQREIGVEAGWIRPFISGLLLLVVILFLPGGLGGLIPRLRRPKLVQAEILPPAEPADGTRELVALEGLGRAYGGVQAVAGVDLVIRSGEVVGLIGPNGAGKTTLVNMISGLIPPTSGRGTVLGLTLGKAGVAHRFAKAGVNRTFQHSKLFDRLSALENAQVGAHVVTRESFWQHLLFLPAARRAEKLSLRQASAALRRVGLAERAADRAGDLSYGDQRRLEIARALAANPSLLILDEPAAGMNHVEADDLGALIRSLAADGLTVLLIEHNVRMVLETCTRVVVLNFGEVIATGTPDEIAADRRVIDAYLGASQPGDHGAEPAGIPLPDSVGSDRVGSDGVGSDGVGSDGAGSDSAVTVDGPHGAGTATAASSMPGEDER